MRTKRELDLILFLRQRCQRFLGISNVEDIEVNLYKKNDRTNSGIRYPLNKAISCIYLSVASCQLPVALGKKADIDELEYAMIVQHLSTM